ncbi:acyl-CoA thioesterase [Metabacillus arenae]|uniref:Acyl-CoA thioesterase n=1 Tax=Metabacillus arenae TaxID=2771434 RepID=A0A926NBF2_9BACI|nr:acyl-CoA thioesterase [Metabacillus arenae]MBD1381157.1 acyl-CoA thioesterase [Metabacillus arenae]
MKSIIYIQPDYQTWKNGFTFFQQVKVRFSETDLFGHMNNVSPILYFEEARIEFFKHIGMMEEWMKKDSETIPVAANIQCDYMKQVYFNEVIQIFVKAFEIGNSSVNLHYLGLNENQEPCFAGQGTIVQISRRSGKAVNWLESDKKRLFEKNSVKL